MNTFSLPIITEDPQLMGSPIRPACRSFANTVIDP